MTKKEQRKLVFARRKEASDRQIEENSAAITQSLLKSREYQEAKTVFAYIDYRPEVMTRALIEQAWKDGKRVAVPRVNGDVMNFYYLDSFDQLAPGCKGIPEPVTEQMGAGRPCAPADADEKALMIVPGVAFDVQRHRIGYGGGYYDKYLSAHPEHPTAAVAFEFQILEEVPVEPTDRMPDAVYTESRILR